MKPAITSLPVVEKCEFFQGWIFFEVLITPNPSTIVIFDQQYHTKCNTKKCEAFYCIKNVYDF